MTDFRMCLADPVWQIEQECADKACNQDCVALTYALAMRDEDFVPVDWRAANAAIRNRWPKGLERVKQKAHKLYATLPVRATTQAKASGGGSQK